MSIRVSKEERDAIAAYVEGTLSPLITMLLVKQLSMAAVFLRDEVAKQGARPDVRMLTPKEIDRIVYELRQSGEDTTYNIVNAAIRAAMAQEKKHD